MSLWVDQYAPKNLDDYVWRDTKMKEKFIEWIAGGSLPHLLFSGRAGMGKTSLARLLLKCLDVPEGDILFVKAGKERKIDLLEDRITGFCQTYPMFGNTHELKYIILDEADLLSAHAQKFLRSEMEHYSSTVRFILTCNYPEKIIPAIHSRCQSFHFEALSQDDFVLRLLSILNQEQVKFDSETLIDYIEDSYPDMRKCIGLLQKNTINKELMKKTESTNNLDYMVDVFSLFKNNKHSEARKLIISQVQPDEYPEVYRFLYTNIHEFFDNLDHQDDALVIIRDGLYKHALIADPEINLSATLVELARLKG